MFTSQRLRDVLYSRRMKQRDLARAIGCSEVAMSRYCNTDRCPRSDIIKKMAMTLGVTVDYLLGGYDPNTPDAPDTAYKNVIQFIRENRDRWTREQCKTIVAELYGKEE